MSKKTNTIAMIAVIAVGLIICTALLFLKDSSVNELKKESKTNEESIAKLKLQLEEVGIEPAETVEEIQTKLTSAAQAGAKLAELQNAYQTLGTGTPEKEAALIANGDEISSYLDDPSSRGAWYIYKVDGSGFEWNFESTYSFEGNEIPAVWTCRHKDTGELLAFAIATYHADDGKFYGLEYHRTSAGADHAINDVG